MPRKNNTRARHALLGEARLLYSEEKDVYICPGGDELRFWSTHNARMQRLYRSDKCSSCELRSKCTSDKIGRILARWEHGDILDDMRKRVKR